MQGVGVIRRTSKEKVETVSHRKEFIVVEGEVGGVRGTGEGAVRTR